MVTKNFLVVCKSRETGAIYLSRNVYACHDLQSHIVYMDSINVDVVDIIPVELDLSKYEH